MIINTDNHNSNQDNSNNGDNNKISLQLFINTFHAYIQCHVSCCNYLLVSQTSCLTPRTVMGLAQRDGTLISQGHTAITPIYFLITKNRGHPQGLIMRNYQPVIRWKQELVKQLLLRVPESRGSLRRHQLLLQVLLYYIYYIVISLFCWYLDVCDDYSIGY